MSEENLLTSDADVCTATTNKTPAPTDFVKVDIKIEKYDSEPDDIFEPEIQVKVEPGTAPSSIDIKSEGKIISADGHSALKLSPEEKDDQTCEHCGRIFKRGRALTLHMRSHIGRKYDAGTYICNRCQRAFTYKVNLIRHLRGSHCTFREKLVTCSVCEREFTSEANLRRHISSYHTARPHKCDLCGKMFKDTGAVFRHRLRHENESSGEAAKQFPCSVCGKTFAIVNALECHLRTHTKEQPFKCSMCVRAFSHKHNMLRHMQRHNKVLHLKCEICQKEFPRESRLKYHMRVHILDKKPYRCGECPKTYSHQQSIIRHYKKKHPHVEYIPPTTDAEFANKAWNLRMEQSIELDNREYILPEFQQPDNLNLKEQTLDSESPIAPELVIVNNSKEDVITEPELAFDSIQIKVEPV